MVMTLTSLLDSLSAFISELYKTFLSSTFAHWPLIENSDIEDDYNFDDDDDDYDIEEDEAIPRGNSILLPTVGLVGQVQKCTSQITIDEDHRPDNDDCRCGPQYLSYLSCLYKGVSFDS